MLALAGIGNIPIGNLPIGNLRSLAVCYYVPPGFLSSWVRVRVRVMVRVVVRVMVRVRVRVRVLGLG